MLASILRRPFDAFAAAWRAIDAQRLPAAAPSWRAHTYLYTGGVLLVVALWVGNRGFFSDHFASDVDPSWPFAGMYGELWWAGWTLLCFGLGPALVIKLTGGTLRAHGLTLRGFFGHLPLYLGLLTAVTPLVLLASLSPTFQETYPLCREAARSWSHFALWEAAYFLQFVSLELFFRGFWLFGLVRHLGAYVLPVMIVPYALIHMGKPLPEALGAIVAGTVLGVVALHTRSIAGGVLVHYGVALTMDILALVRRGELFT